MQIQRIEINFAIPVEVTEAQERAIHDLVSAIVKVPANQRDGHFHWVSGHGCKPIWSLADQRAFGLRGTADAPASGEPTFDASTLQIETAFREMHESEKQKAGSR